MTDLTENDWETVDMSARAYMESEKPDTHRWMNIMTIGAATVIREYNGLGQHRIIEWGVYDDYGQDRGRVSYCRTLEIGDAIYYSIIKTLYGRAWGYDARKRAESWGILAQAQQEIPLARGRSYD